MFFLSDDSSQQIEDNIDEHGDSYTRDVTTEELRKVFGKIHFSNLLLTRI
jgi:hypothetical protein